MPVIITCRKGTSVYAGTREYTSMPKTQLATGHHRSDFVNSVLSPSHCGSRCRAPRATRADIPKLPAWWASKQYGECWFRGTYLKCTCGSLWSLPSRKGNHHEISATGHRHLAGKRECIHTFFFYCYKLIKYYSGFHFTAKYPIFWQKIQQYSFSPSWKSTRKKDSDSCRFHTCQRHKPCSYRWIAQKWAFC